MEYLYRHFDKDGKLLYVGLTGSHRQRLQAHKYNSHWFPLVAEVKIEKFASRAEAVAAENHAIFHEKPIHNIVGSSLPKLKESGDAIIPFSPRYLFSNREIDILRLIVDGLDDDEVGEVMGIATATAQSRRRDLLKKAGVHKTPKLMIFGRRYFGLDSNTTEKAISCVQIG